ncbi:DUF3021 domain-containing protein [Vagococcus teuberi]|uniref:DUF3021 domain-containing protein n=1 Tax=Vagococcus teuberi TaxID=519472 RepID=A0A1J0A599_9ENTE|nr:DUF3021 domain-containing protein [Vagococcus teuberi]APB31089.1 hypothetical protein BHY08_04145 [Vagococcus teuberi]
MNKHIVFQIFSGFKTGVFIGLMFSIFFSFIYSGDFFSPMPPAFVDKFSSELIAFIVSVFLWGVIGVIFTLTNFIFTSTDWSITRMTVSHAIISYCLFLPIAIFLNWINLSVTNIVTFTMIYLFIYAILWLISIIRVKKEINSINKHIKE